MTGPPQNYYGLPSHSFTSFVPTLKRGAGDGIGQPRPKHFKASSHHATVQPNPSKAFEARLMAIESALDLNSQSGNNIQKIQKALQETCHKLAIMYVHGASNRVLPGLSLLQV